MKLISFLVFLFTYQLSFGSFIVLEKDNNVRSMEFNDYELLEIFYLNKIKYKKFEKEMLSKANASFQELLGCDDLTPSGIDAECLERIKNYEGSYRILIPVFWVEDDRLSGLTYLIRESLTSHYKLFHPEVATKLLLSDMSEYELGDNSFYSTQKEKVLRDILSAIESYPGSSYDKNGVCTVLVNEDTLSISDTEEYRPSKTFNMEKCQKLFTETNLYSWTEGLVLEDELETLGPIEAYHPKLRSLVESVLNQELMFDLVSTISTKIYPKDSEYSFFGHNLIIAGYDYMTQKIFANFTDLETNLAGTIVSNSSNYVEYNGVLGTHSYKSKNYLNSVFNLWINLTQDFENSRDFLIQNDYSKYFVDTNSEEEATRLEPMDLVSNLIYRQMQVNQWGFKIGANSKNYFKEVLRYTTGLTEKIENPLYIYTREPKHTGLKMLCAFPESLPDAMFDDFENTKVPFLKTFEIQSDFNNDEGTKEFLCSESRIKFDSSRVEGDPLTIPSKPTISDGYIDIVMPYSLTAELNNKLQALAIKYFKAMGYKLEETQIDNVKEFVASELATTDVLMPAGHALASRDLTLGTKKGQLLTFSREAKDEEKYGVRFKFILPVQTSSHEAIQIGELASAYAKRIENNLNSLFVFVISCNSENNLGDWSLIYRKAMEKFGRDAGMTPFVIASKRGFPTSSNVDIAGSIFYPTDVADQLALGKSPQDVYEFFLTKKYKSIAEELKERIGPGWMNSKSNKGDILREIMKKPENETFEPAYNLSDEYRDMILKMSGMRYKIYREETLIYDETF